MNVARRHGFAEQDGAVGFNWLHSVRWLFRTRTAVIASFDSPER